MLIGKIEQKLQLDRERERSTHKGGPFEEIVKIELEAFHGSLGDKVRFVRNQYGLLPKRGKGAMAGDHLIVLNPLHTRGREVAYVVEAKTGPLSSTEAERALVAATENRGTVGGVLVFDGVEDAPLGGRRYMDHGNGRYTAVLDVQSGDTLAFEVACRQARAYAIASVRSEGRLHQDWVHSQCDHLCEVVEEAGAILSGASTVERAAGDIRERYVHMRRRAFELLDEVRERTAEGPNPAMLWRPDRQRGGVPRQSCRGTPPG